MGLSIQDLRILSVAKGGFQCAAHPNTLKASAGGFVNIIKDLAIARILKKKEVEKAKAAKKKKEEKKRKEKED